LHVEIYEHPYNARHAYAPSHPAVKTKAAPEFKAAQRYDKSFLVASFFAKIFGGRKNCRNLCSRIL
jgi:hypothetical protein